MQKNITIKKTAGKSGRLIQLVSVLLALFCTSGLWAQVGTAPVNPPTGGFAVDGFLQRQGAAGDWLAGPGGSAAGTIMFSSVAPGAPLFPNPPILSYHPIDLYNDNVNDEIFDGGNKLFQDPNTWGWRSGKPPAKDDINNSMIFITTNPTDGHIWALISGDRMSTNGTSYLDFEFYQNTITRTGGPIPGGTGGFTSEGPNGGRTIGDLSVTLEYVNGGTVSNISYLRWQNTSETTFDYVSIAPPAGTTYGAANAGVVNVPYGAFGETTYQPLQFVEAAIDITALIGTGSNDPCLALQFKTLFIKTKSSAETTADLKDFIEPIQFVLNLGVATIDYNDPFCSNAGVQNVIFTGPGSTLGGTYTISAPQAGSNVTINATTGAITVGVVCTTATYTVTYSYSPRPGCNKTATTTVVVNPPAAATLAAIPGNITVACGAIPAVSGLNYTNGGSGSCLISGTITSTQTAAPGPCGGVVTETWASVLDVCGRTIAGGSRTITVSPAALPTFAAAGNITVACGAIPAPSSLSYTNGGSGGCLISGSATSTQTAAPGPCGGVVTETWNATDACGRSLAPRVRTITVSAAALPTFAAAGNITVACGQIPAVSSLSYTNGGSGNCLITGSATSTQTSAPGPCGGVVTETWTATDACGRALTPRVRTITVTAAGAATFAAAANITVACGQIPAVSSLAYTNGGAGNCLVSGSATSTQTAPPGPCGGIVTETWNATDACGRTLPTRTRTILVQPAAVPTFSAPPGNITAACGSTPPVSSLSYSNGGSGNCLISGAATSTQTAAPGTCGGTITETWSATDQCGRVIQSVTRLIIVPAPPAPTFTTTPGNITIACSAAPPSPSGLNYSNVGSGPCLIAGTVTSSITGSHNACGGRYTETWSFTDGCSRTITHSRAIVVSAAPAPTFTAVGNITISCSSAPPTPSGLNYTNAGSGVCVIAGTVTSSITGSHNGCGGTYTETWSFTDACGRTLNAVRTIFVSPAALPTFNAAGNISVACGAIPAPSSLGYTNGGSGGCLISGNATSTQTAAPGPCGGVVTETWNATDACGRALAPRVRTITVAAAPLPTFNAAPNITVACGAIPGVSSLTYTNGGSGNCLLSGAATSTQTAAPGACGGVVTETWNATDACGRTLAPRVRTIVVNPANQASFVSPPGDIVSNICGVAPVPSVLSYTNGQSAGCAIAGTVSSTINGAGNCGVFTETWTFTDACGRTINRSRTITVPCCSASICTYTQGAYGSDGGTMCNGEPADDPGPNEFNTFDMITNSINNLTVNSYAIAGCAPALSGVAPFVNQTLVIGKPGRSLYITSSAADVNKVIEYLPGGGGSRELDAGNYSISSIPTSYLSDNTGRLNNALLAQTITLGLNLGIGTNLGTFVLQGGVLVTAEAEECGSSTPLVRVCNYNPLAPYNLLSVTNDYSYHTISAAVVNAICGPKTVAGLFELANRALANSDGVLNKEGGVNISAIADAVDKINNAFDECRIFIGWNVAPCAAINPNPVLLTSTRVAGGASTIEVNTLAVNAYPNPFTDKVRFVVAAPTSGKGTLEVYNALGQKISTVYRGHVIAGQSTFEYNVPVGSRTHLFYVFRLNDQQVSGKLLSLQE